MIEIISKPSERRCYSVYDLEWIPGTLQLRMVGVYDERGYRFYTSIEDFLNKELTHRNRGRWFYAHAGGLADVQFVLAAIKNHNERRGNSYKVDASTSGSSAIIVNISKGGNKWTFCDSYWLLRDKLKNIGKWIGKNKGSGTSFEEEEDPDEIGITDEEYERRMGKRKEWYASAPLWELVGYNEQDCIILYEAIAMFQDALLQMGGQLQMTLASCAMQLFRRKYLTKDMPTFGEVNDKARQSYFCLPRRSLRRED